MHIYYCSTNTMFIYFVSWSCLAAAIKWEVVASDDINSLDITFLALEPSITSNL